MLSKTVMGPLTRALGHPDYDLIKMNQVYASLIKFFDEVSENPTSLLEAASPFSEELLHRDQWFRDLFQPNPRYDHHTQTIAAITAKSLANFSHRQFADHLDGGIHANISQDAGQRIPTHNMAMDRAFGYWDQKWRRIPAMSSIAMKACVLFMLNKTWNWLEEKLAAEQEQIIRTCQRQTPAMKAKFKERSVLLQHQLEERL